MTGKDETSGRDDNIMILAALNLFGTSVLTEGKLKWKTTLNQSFN